MILPSDLGQDAVLRPGSAAVRPPRPARLDALTLAFYVVIATYIWRWQDMFHALGRVRPAVLGLGAILALFALDTDVRRQLRLAWHPITKAGVAILALAILSVPGSLWPGRSFFFIVDDFAKNVIIFFYLAASIRSAVDVRRMIGMILVGGIVYAMYAMLVAPMRDGRMAGTPYYDANDVACFLVSSLPLGLFFVLRAKSKLVRFGAALSLLLFVLTIIKSGSRGGFLGLIAVGLYVLLAWGSVRKSYRYGVIITAVAAMLTFGGPQYWEMMGTLLHPKDDYNWSGQAESGRMEVWRRGIGYMMTHPILGVGARCFGTAEGQISPLAARQQYGIGLKWSAAHNSYVQIGAELGVFGLVFFVLMLVRSYKASRSVAERSRGSPSRRATDAEVLGEALAGAIVGFAVAGFFLSQAYAAYLFVLCGTIAGFARVEAGAESPPRAPRRRRRPAGYRLAEARDPNP